PAGIVEPSSWVSSDDGRYCGRGGGVWGHAGNALPYPRPIGGRFHHRHPADVGGWRFDVSALRDERGLAEGRLVHLQRLGPGRLSEGVLAQRARVGVVAAAARARWLNGNI